MKVVKHFANDTEKYKMQLSGDAVACYIQSQELQPGIPVPADLVKQTHRRAKLHNETITKAP